MLMGVLQDDNHQGKMTIRLTQCMIQLLSRVRGVGRPVRQLLVSVRQPRSRTLRSDGTQKFRHIYKSSDMV